MFHAETSGLQVTVPFLHALASGNLLLTNAIGSP